MKQILQARWLVATGGGVVGVAIMNRTILAFGALTALCSSVYAQTLNLNLDLSSARIGYLQTEIEQPQSVIRGAEGIFSTDLVLEEGELLYVLQISSSRLELVELGGDPNSPELADGAIRYQREGGTSGFVGDRGYLVGPARVSVGWTFGDLVGPLSVFPGGFQNTETARSVLTYAIWRTGGASGDVSAGTQTVPSNVAVIPNDANGRFEVMLESSVDLVTWNAANPGTFGGDTRRRFFRTRIGRRN